MQVRVVVAALALVVAAGAACGSSTSDSPGSGTGVTGGSTPGTGVPAALEDTSWVLATFLGTARESVPAVPDSATLAFAKGGTLNGSTGCNQFSGTYTGDAQKLTIKLGPTTLAGCPGPLLDAQQTAVLALLPAVTGYARTDDSLTLKAADGATLFTYKPGLAGLPGTSWTVTGVNNGNQAVEGTALTEKLTAKFEAASAFSGFGGCNQLRGTYTTTGKDGLTITGLASTMMACDEAASTLEAQYQAALGKVATYTIAGDQLTMRASDGATQVTAKLVK